MTGWRWDHIRYHAANPARATIQVANRTCPVGCRSTAMARCRSTRFRSKTTTTAMEDHMCNIQVLLRAAEFLERREREAEHGYASVLPLSPGHSDRKSKQKSRKISAGGNRSVHNELEKNRRAQLKHCLDQLKEQVPLSSDAVRSTTLNLLRRAQLHIKKLQDQDERAEQMKGRLRWEQRELRVRLEQLQRGTERMRNNSQGSTMSSERSDSDREDVEVDVESIVFDCVDPDGLITHADADHCYSSMDKAWL